ncbi:MAG TPA: mandelate racemase/muconate lactonizing enzyme family protein [Terriglobia bacterium]|nr:mandelate racemase/muconate lactonizing enzyme family protein [Terriglobia bacterium]
MSATPGGRMNGGANRRTFLKTGAAALTGATFSFNAWLEAHPAAPKLRVTGMELLPVRATERTVWLLVRLRTDAGLTGLGEASDAFGFANTTSEDARAMRAELGDFFRLIDGKSPLEIEAYRQQGMPRARRGLVSATAFSALEQCLWDLAGKALEAPSSALFGGRVRDTLPVYANINRATKPRTPAGFAAAARKAFADGFRAMKAAPFDGFPAAGSPSAEIDAAVNNGIDAVTAMREAVGPDTALMVDCHSFFDVSLAVRVAQRLEAARLTWYEEPVAPDRVDDTAEIHRRIRQPMAGGELLFGVAGFAPLTRARAVDVIMPDVKHCGGLLELTHIAALAGADGVRVAPHNPSGPVSTAASMQICAVLENFNYLELQWGETDWRGDVLDPPEVFTSGTIRVPDRPGFGVELNDRVIRNRLI